jgi:hypothetical protein
MVVAIGLVVAWMISPVEYVDAPPYDLRADFKDEYRALVAAAYLYSGDLQRAEDRLAQLKDDNVTQSLTRQAQQALAEGRPESVVKALGLLAVALGEGLTPPAPSATAAQTTLASNPVEPPTITPMPLEPIIPPGGTDQPVSSPLPTNFDTPAATQPSTSIPTPSEAPSSGFVLRDTQLVCNPDQTQPLIQVEVADTAGEPAPGVELVVTWNEGEDHFFTGLKPELGLGYADFTMTPDVVYSLQFAEGEPEINDLTAAQCLSQDETKYWGSWLLTFTQP